MYMHQRQEALTGTNRLSAVKDRSLSRRDVSGACVLSKVHRSVSLAAIPIKPSVTACSTRLFCTATLKTIFFSGQVSSRKAQDSESQDAYKM